MGKWIIALFLIPLSALANDYCAAIRGNGENVAAHWSALSRLVEENGMPSAMAGGSSATISMFLLNSISGNGSIKGEADAAKKRKKEALLIKSLGEFVAEMGRTEEFASAYALLNELSQKDSPISTKLQRLVSGNGPVSPADLSTAVQKFLPLVNPEMIQGLATRPAFFKGELGKAVNTFGSFDAVGDRNMFFRPGLVDFKEFAINIGHIADFYAGNTDEDTKKELENFTNECADNAYRRQWSELPADGCKSKFRRMVSNYLRKGRFQNKAVFENVGSQIRSIPTTALVQGEAVNRFNDLRSSYLRGEAGRDYGAFTVDFDRELRFGYWTSEGDRIRRGLQPLVSRGDLKSQKFEAMPPGNWFEVLSTSPAEPGLASLQPIPVNTTRDRVLAERQRTFAQRWQGLEYRRGVLSAGGWSDLHPVPVLKAAGCSRVAYITRKDGETVFGQQTFIRLTGSQEDIPFWDKIADSNNTGWRVTGNTERSPWNRLYNYGNPQSSFNLSLGSADITYCTDWNRFEPFKGQMTEMEREAYTAPVFVVPGVPDSFRVNRPNGPPNPATFPGCLPARGPLGSRASAATAGDRPAL